ncbi:MAG: ATP-dependent helicase [Phycisphaerales bacterium]
MLHPGDIVPLNDAQREAVNHTGTPLLVLAGPGTGKTRVIIARLLRLLLEGREPDSLLAVTFSVKATQEMRSRLSEWAAEHLPADIAAGASKVHISTFHGLGRRLVRRFGDVLGVAPEPSLLDDAVAKRTLRKLVRDLGLFPHLAAEGHHAVLDEHLKFAAACKHNARTPDDALAHARAWAARLETNQDNLDNDALKAAKLSHAAFADHARLYDAFDRACLKEGLFTFDDDLAYPLRIFRKRPELAAYLRAEHRHVVVDELQDVNPAQLELLKWIAPPAPRGASTGTDLCAVGDDDQAIYAFRGSDPAAVEAFRALWPTHHAVKLEENHRSAPRIVAVGNAVIERAHHRALGGKVIRAADTEAGPGVVEAYAVPDDKDHAHLVAALILQDKSSNPHRKWSDYAVLARGGAQLERTGAALALKGIPIDFRQRPTPRDEPAVQDLFAWLNLLTNARDDASTQRLLIRPSLGVNLEQVRAWREAHAAERRASQNQQNFPGLADWLATATSGVRAHEPRASASGPSRPAPTSPNPEPAVARFIELLTELRRTASTMPADHAVENLIRTAHLMGDDSPELLDPAQHTRRARALVDAVRFVRSRQPFLEHPADIAAYLAYDRDLDDEGKNFRAPGLETEQNEEGEQRPDAVSVITAHRAKGLEWDTVFVVKIGRTNGSFAAGTREDPGDHKLPADFTGRPEPSDHDEEIRVLYVACTRAKRRLVLTAKKKAAPKKKDTSSDDVFVQLTHFRPDLQVPATPMEDTLRAVGVETPTLLEEELAAAARTASRDEQLRRELVHARQWAFAALHDAAAPDLDEAAMRTVERRLSDAAHAVAALAALRAGTPPRHLETLAATSPLRARVESLIKQLAQQHALPLWPAPKPPLRLSYTQISNFQDCPRCWYLRTVLGLPDRGSTEANLGAVAHEALHLFYRKLRDAEDDPENLPLPRDLHALADAAFDKHFKALDPNADDERKKLHAQLDALLTKLHPTTSQVLELEFEVHLPITDARGITHLLTAKIDRLDLEPDGTYRLIDYKTGQPSKKLLEPAKDDLQLNIYALALAHHINADDRTPPTGRAEYWVLAQGAHGSINLADLNLDKTRETILKTIDAMLTPPYLKGKGCRGHCDLMG